jgi:hypothetical protein
MHKGLIERVAESSNQRVEKRTIGGVPWQLLAMD